MARLTIWYSVQNGGDGSAYPHWFETRELAEMDQDLMEEGWGESCTGSITFEGDNLRCVDRVTTKEDFIKELDEIINEKWYGVWIKRKAQEFKDKLVPPEKEEKPEEKTKWYKDKIKKGDEWWKKDKEEEEWKEENEKLKSFNDIINDN